MPIRTQYRPQVLPTFNLKRSPLPGTRSAAASQIATKTRARFIHKLVQTYCFCHAYFPQARAQQLLIAQVSCPAETPCAIIHLEERRRFHVNPVENSLGRLRRVLPHLERTCFAIDAAWAENSHSEQRKHNLAGWTRCQNGPARVPIPNSIHRLSRLFRRLSGKNLCITGMGISL